MHLLTTRYSENCYYWECVISFRKCVVLAVSVFLTTAGAEAQALCGMMICMVALIFHLHWKPFIQVAPGRNTLFWAEFWALFVAFLTFWTGLFFYQDVASSGPLQMAFTVELITVNSLFVLMAMRWFLILKLMDMQDLIMTRELQGTAKEDLKGAKKQTDWLKMLVPEWKVVKHLWAKKAWKTTIRHQIMANRSLRAFGGSGAGGGFAAAVAAAAAGKSDDVGGASEAASSSGGAGRAAVQRMRRRNTFQTSEQRRMAEEAMRGLGLGSNDEARHKREEKEKRELAKARKQKQRAQSRRRLSWRSSSKLNLQEEVKAIEGHGAGVKHHSEEAPKSAKEVMQDKKELDAKNNKARARRRAKQRLKAAGTVVRMGVRASHITKDGDKGDGKASAVKMPQRKSVKTTPPQAAPEATPAPEAQPVPATSPAAPEDVPVAEVRPVSVTPTPESRVRMPPRRRRSVKRTTSQRGNELTGVAVGTPTLPSHMPAPAAGLSAGVDSERVSRSALSDPSTAAAAAVNSSPASRPAAAAAAKPKMPTRAKVLRPKPDDGPH